MTGFTLDEIEMSIRIAKRQIRRLQRKGKLDEVKKIKESYFFAWLLEERDKRLEKVVFT